MIELNLLTISNYGWNGISICTIETSENIYSLFHIEKSEGLWKLNFLFFIRFIY